MRQEQNDERPLWGVEAIGEFIGRKPRQTYYLLQQGLIPGQKVGTTWTALPSRLRARFSGEGERQ
jgi:hypothetical protein